MRCSQAVEWLQLYVDDRLELSHLAQLERHVHQCPSCQRELAAIERVRAVLTPDEAVAEPADLERVIRARITLYELQRTAEAAERQARRLAWRERSWQVAALVSILVLTYLLLPSATQSSLNATLYHGLPGLLDALTAPGPDSVAWAAWAVGALAVLSLAVYLARADASAGLRRSIAERLPQLW
jgi:anti-sigma factor RsiW